MIGPLETAPRRVLPETERCRACGAAGLIEFARASKIPVSNARVCDSAEEALEVPTGELQLAFCPSCGFIENAMFDRSLVVYDSSYEEQQSYSPTFTRFADQLVRDLVERWDLHGKKIVEIGCGKGDFLASLCALGNNDGIGIDPSALQGRLMCPGADRVTLIPEFYTAQTPRHDADALFCRHTLEHIPDVAEFVRMVRGTLEGAPNTRVFFEVPDVSRVLREGAFWDVYFEHCAYFTCGSLARLFRREGFTVDSVSLAFDRQYILLEARPVPSPADAVPHEAEESPEEIERLIDAYAAHVSSIVTHWRRRVASIRATGGRVAVWGSGSKCVTFLAETALNDSIDAVVDVNPHRHGRYLPGTGRIVAAPTSLAELKPSLVIVMNPIYRDEIARDLRAMHVAASVEAL